ncbi:MAG: FHA domain-containing serine/threonine-protein kinase [Caldilineaceae bacterium]
MQPAENQPQTPEEPTNRAPANERYVLQDLLGPGRLGDVYRGWDANLEQAVAVKQIKAEVAALPGFGERVIPSVRAFGRVIHPGIVRVTDVGQSEADYYVVMELLQGPHLAYLLEQLRVHQQRLTLLHGVRLVQTVAQAAHVVYEQSGQHYRLMPTKIKFRSTYAPQSVLHPLQPVIVDLGLAHLLPPGWLLQFVHDPQMLTYFSPEEILGETTDIRSDVYTLGMLLFVLITGRAPFTVQTIGEAVDIHLNRPLPTPQSIQPATPAILAAIVTKALAPQPADRYATIGQLYAALAAIPDDVLTAFVPASDDVRYSTLPFFYEEHQAEPKAVDSSPKNDKHPGVILPNKRPHGASPPSLTPSPTPSLLSSTPVTAVPMVLEVQMLDGESRRVPLTEGVLTIGRTPDNGLVLDEPRVSRQHARVEFDGQGYHIVDLRSANGTFLNKERLPAGGRAPWGNEATVRISKFTLRLVASPVAEAPVAEPVAPEPLVVDAAQIYIELLKRAIERTRLTCSPDGVTAAFLLGHTTLDVTPGERATLPLIIINQQATAAFFDLVVTGPAAPWCSFDLPHHELQPGEQREVHLLITPPRQTQTRADTHLLQIVMTCRQTPTQTAQGQVRLKVRPFAAFRATLMPAQIRAGETLQVAVEHQGNRIQNYKVAWHTDAPDLYFEETQEEITLAPGETKSVAITPFLSKQRWLGGAREHRVAIQISTTNAQMQRLEALITSRSRLPL